MEVLRLAETGTDRAEDALEPFFPGLRLGSARAGELAFTIEAHAFAAFTVLAYGISGPPLRASTDPAPFAVCEVKLEGQLRTPDDVVDSTRPFTTYSDMSLEATSLRARTLTFDEDRLRDFARADLGDDSFTLDPTQRGRVSDQAARGWKTVADLAIELARAGTADDPIVGGRISELLMSTYLRTFASNWTDARRLADGQHSDPAGLRRARAFIEENFADPITSADIATASRMSIRGIQAAFERNYGISPMRYLRQVRLNFARQALLSADPTAGDHVAAIAASAGFAHMARFASVYRQTFGELPSETLRR